MSTHVDGRLEQTTRFRRQAYSQQRAPSSATMVVMSNGGGRPKNIDGDNASLEVVGVADKFRVGPRGLSKKIFYMALTQIASDTKQ